MEPSELRAIAHDAAAFEAFYREHVAAVQSFVARRVDRPELVADLTADIFLATIDAAARYRPDRGEPRAWLFGVARKVVASELRRGARERRAVRRVEGQRLLENDDIVRIQERIDAQARARTLYAALDALPESERAVFELVAIDELSVGDAADALTISAVAARVRLHRARSSLQAELAAQHPTTTRPMEASQ
jgi:RNA polymerase sigma-70 factor (ECF subfamily)